MTRRQFAWDNSRKTGLSESGPPTMKNGLISTLTIHVSEHPKMPNGKPGDHPLTDILVHKLTVYGHEADDLIRKIAELCSFRELDEWWQHEIGWSPEPHSVVNKARMRLDELLQRAKDHGWETKQ
jgi:hypothetical protein